MFKGNSLLPTLCYFALLGLSSVCFAEGEALGGTAPAGGAASEEQAQNAPEIASGLGVLKADLLPENALDLGREYQDETMLKRTPLSLQEAIDAALRGNYSLHYERYEPAKEAQNIEIEEAEFEPDIELSLGYSENNDPRDTSTLEGSSKPQSTNFNYTLSASKKFSPGTIVKLWTGSARAWSNSSYSILNPNYSGKIGIDVSQPLLKGAGTLVNLAPIAIARSGKRESELRLRKQILDTILNSEIAYWNLSAAYASRDLRRSNVELAKKLLEENKAKFNVGIIRRQDVLQAEANLASAEEKIIIANLLIEKCNDELLGTFGKLEFDNNPKFRVVILPQENVVVPEFRRVVSGALSFDLDLQIALELIDRRKLEYAVADDNVNPTLNLRAGASALGLEAEYLDSYKSAFDAKGYTWNAGVDFSLPWGLRAERARQTQAQLSLRQSQVNLSNVRQDLMASLRLAFRNLQSGIETRKSTARTLALNIESFDQQKALYDAGLASFRDVLQAQRDLDDAKSAYLDAVYDVIISQSRLSRLDGSILRRNGFNWGNLGEYELEPSSMSSADDSNF